MYRIAETRVIIGTKSCTTNSIRTANSDVSVLFVGVWCCRCCTETTYNDSIIRAQCFTHSGDWQALSYDPVTALFRSIGSQVRLLCHPMHTLIECCHFHSMVFFRLVCVPNSQNANTEQTCYATFDSQRSSLIA